MQQFHNLSVETSEKSHIKVILRSDEPAWRQAGNLAFTLKIKNEILPIRYAQCQNDNRQQIFHMSQLHYDGTSDIPIMKIKETTQSEECRIYFILR